MSREFWVALVLAFVCVAGTTAATAPTAPTASITAQDSRTLPEIEFAIEDEQFTATDVTVKDPGETFEVDVSISNSQQYKLAIYNTDEQIEKQERRTGSGPVTFDLTGYQAGTYLLVVNQDGTFLAVHPILVRGYSVSVSSPSEATEGETIRVEASPSQLRGETVDHVEMFVTDGTDVVRTNATVRDGTYVANVDLSGLDPGSYEVFATVRGTDTAYGEAEVLGLSRGNALDIVSSSSSEDSSSGGASSGGGDTGGGSSGDGTTGDAGDTTSPSTPSPEPSATPPSPSATPDASPTLTPSASPTETTTPVESVTDDGVTTPASPTATQSPTDGGGPGFGLLAALLALAAVALLGRRG